jgi:hypothetical protein
MIGTSKSIWGFDPRSVPGCQLWLDGNDVSVLFSDVAGTSAITTNGQTIRCWKDKSGRGCNATQAGNAPIWNSSNYVNFTQSLGQFMNLPNGTLPFASGTNAYSIFAVANLNNTSGGLKTIIGNGSAGTNSFNALQIQAQSIANLWYNNDVAGGSLTANTFFIANIAFDGSTRYIYQTGTSVNTTASSGWAAPNTNNVIGVEPATGNWYYDGNIGEILVYNTALTTSQRQQVEGYLAHKWGVQTSIPSTHPFYSIRPHLRAFNPTDIDGCQLWLDAADQSSFILSGSNVTQIRDKSANGYVFTGSAGTYPTQTTTINGLPVISSATGQYLRITNFNQNFLTATCFFIMRPTQDLSTLPQLFPTYTVIRGTGSVSIIETGVQYYQAKYYPYLYQSGQGFLSGNELGFSPLNKVLLITGTVTGTGATNEAYVNGSLNIRGGENGTFSQLSSQILNCIGHPSNSHGYDFAEILVFGTVLTSAQRQQVEGYLAHKWGITISAALPSTHPFKSFQPASIPFSPRNISGLQLWLDGADQSSMTLSGSNVTQWNDKSGNGYNATAAPSRTAGTYSTSFRAVNFPTSTTGYITNYTAAPTNETMFVVFNNPTASYNNNILIGGVQGARSLGAGYSGSGGQTVGVVGNLNTQVAWLARTDAGTYTLGTTALVTSQFTTSTNTISLNGGTTASGGAPGFTAGRVTYLGVDASSASYYYVGYGMEILFYNSVLSTNDRQKVEGYLAHKWAITSSLPAGHPYKTAAP